LGSGLRITSREWAGVVRLEAAEIRIRPKQAGGERAALRMLDHVLGIGGLNALAFSSEVGAMADGPNLVDLIGILLADAAERILRDGLMHDYVTREEELPSLRGRLRFTDQVRTRYGEIDRLLCRYDEHESDIDENRLVAIGLEIARRVCSDAEVRRRTARLHAVYSEACAPDRFEADRVRATLTYDRRNERYRAVHRLAWLFVDQQRVHDLFAPGDVRTFAFLIDMNALFERFVTRLLEDLVAGSQVRVRAQHRERSIILDESTGATYSDAIPDLLLEAGIPPRRIPVDAKYKLYDGRRIDPADVHQAFLYAFGYGDDRGMSSGGGGRTAWIIYPGSRDSTGHRLRIQQVGGTLGARIRAVGLDVDAALSWLEGRGTARPLAELEAAARTA